MTDDDRATLISLADYLDAGAGPQAAAILAALAEADRLRSMLADWRAEAKEQCSRASRMAAENEALRANGPMHLAAEFVAGLRENADLRRKIDRLAAERDAARTVIDALFAAGRGEGLSYHACSAAHDKAADFYRKYGTSVRRADGGPTP